MRIVEHNVSWGYFYEKFSSGGYTNVEPYTFVAIKNKSNITKTVFNTSCSGSGWASSFKNDSSMSQWMVFEDGTMVTSYNPHLYHTRSRSLNYSGLESSYTTSKFDGTLGSGQRNGVNYTVRLLNSPFFLNGETYCAGTDEYTKYMVNATGEGAGKWKNNTCSLVNGSYSGKAYPAKMVVDNRSSASYGSGVDVIEGGSNIPDYTDLRFIAVPEHHKAYSTDIPSDIGIKTGAFSFSFTPSYEDMETVASITCTISGSTAFTASDVASNAQFTATIPQEVFEQLQEGYNTITTTITQETGLSNSYTTAFQKKYVHISLESSAQTVDAMPTSCSLVNAVVLGQGATEQWWVCNNANDASPTWEEYTGDGHVFTNDQKIADDWAVAWKCKIGGASATTQSELIKQVAMGVSYETV